MGEKMLKNRVKFSWEAKVEPDDEAKRKSTAIWCLNEAIDLISSSITAIAADNKEEVKLLIEGAHARLQWANNLNYSTARGEDAKKNMSVL
jgi:hypothetical protein